jgi:hypothetical protein
LKLSKIAVSENGERDVRVIIGNVIRHASGRGIDCQLALVGSLNTIETTSRRIASDRNLATRVDDHCHRLQNGAA